MSYPTHEELEVYVSGMLHLSLSAQFLFGLDRCIHCANCFHTSYSSHFKRRFTDMAQCTGCCNCGSLIWCNGCFGLPAVARPEPTTLRNWKWNAWAFAML
ncbi:hypothetical protein CPC08DRAFT_308739 [Agrocybe pediades]|nr:hypothetical protein CPC08DRAFT_308739 [Agrocybe pediades]